MDLKFLKTAFIKTLPIMAGYMVLGGQGDVEDKGRTRGRFICLFCWHCCVFRRYFPTPSVSKERDIS